MPKLKLNFPETVFKILAAIRREIGSAASLQKIADDQAERFRTRTRLGYGVKARGEKQEKLKPVSSRYAAWRKGIAEFVARTPGGRRKQVKFKFGPPKLHPDAAKGRASNLTATGQLLDAVRAKATTGKLSWFLSPRRAFELMGRKVKHTNPEIAAFQEEQGRTFFELTDAELRNIERQIRQAVLKKLGRRR